MLLLLSTGVADCLKNSCLFFSAYLALCSGHTVIVDFGCDQHKQPGERLAPSDEEKRGRQKKRWEDNIKEWT